MVRVEDLNLALPSYRFVIDCYLVCACVRVCVSVCMCVRGCVKCSRLLLAVVSDWGFHWSVCLLLFGDQGECSLISVCVSVWVCMRHPPRPVPPCSVGAGGSHSADVTVSLSLSPHLSPSLYFSVFGRKRRSKRYSFDWIFKPSWNYLKGADSLRKKKKRKKLRASIHWCSIVVEL